VWCRYPDLRQQRRQTSVGSHSNNPRSSDQLAT
jgi:hypothetical protein